MIFLESKSFTPEGYGSGNLDLVANKNQKIVALFRFRVETFIELASGQTEIEAKSINGSSDSWLEDVTFQNSFEKFEVGDSFNISGTSPSIDGNYTISEKLDNNTIRIATTFAHVGVYTSGFIRLTNEPLAIGYRFGFDGAGNYTSDISGQEQKYFYSNNNAQIGTSFVPMIPAFQVNDNHTVEVRRVSSDTTTYFFVFEVRHTFYYNGYILESELADILANFDQQLGHPKTATFEFKSFLYPNNLNRFDILEELSQGNTANFNRNYFTSTKKYDQDNIIGQLVNSGTSKFEFNINPVPTNISLTFYVIPDSVINLLDTFQNQFAFDYATRAIAASAVNGVNSIIKNFTSVVSGVNLDCEFEIDIDDLPQFVKDKVLTGEQVNYFITARAWDNTKNINDTDFTELIITGGVIQEYIDEDFYTSNLKILKHDINDLSNAGINDTTNEIELKVADEVVLVNDIVIESSLASQFLAALISVNPIIINTKIILDLGGSFKAFIFDETNQYNLISATINQSNNWKVLNSEIRKNRSGIIIDFDLSTEIYTITFAKSFFVNYEYWQQLIIQAANNLDVVVFQNLLADNTQLFNGSNQDWARLQNILAANGGKILFEQTASIGNGFFTDTKTLEFKPKDFLSNPDWINEKIEIFDESGANIQAISGVPYLLANAKNKVVATFEYDGVGDIPPLYGVLRMHVKEQSIAAESFSLSSIYDRSSINGNFWENTANAGLVEVDVVGNIVTLTAFIDGTKVDLSNINYTITATLDREDSTEINVGEVQQVDVILIDTTDEEEETPELPKSPFDLCCYERLVFGDNDTVGGLKNDFNSFYYITHLLNDSEEIKLYKNGVFLVDLDGSANLGDYRKITRERNIVYVYTIQWREVLINYGVGCYHTEFMGKKSDKFTLKHYHKNLADNSVRIDFTLNTTVGDKNQKLRKDFNGLNIVDSVRLKRAMFGFPTFPINEEKTRIHNSGIQKTTFTSFDEEYELHIQTLPLVLHNLFKYRILLSTEIKIIDYNSENTAGTFVGVLVRPNDKYEPNYSSPYLPIIYRFIDGISNRRLVYEKESILNQVTNSYTPAPAPSVCLPATYEVLDQDSVIYGTGSIPSGTFAPINIIVTKPQGITFQIPVPSSIISNTPNQDAGFRYANSFFNYNNPQPTKIQPCLDFTHANTHFNLKENISFRGESNKKRFVDIRGLQDFTTYPNVFIDKKSGLVYRRNFDTAQTESASFTDTENFSVTVDGITLNDWYMASIEEVFDVFGFGKVTNDLDIIDPDSGAIINAGVLTQNLRTSSRNSSTQYNQVNFAFMNAGAVASTAPRAYMMVSKELLTYFDDYI
jgi:hypothetical protein